jgi:hypothetical protein
MFGNFIKLTTSVFWISIHFLRRGPEVSPDFETGPWHKKGENPWLILPPGFTKTRDAGLLLYNFFSCIDSR